MTTSSDRIVILVAVIGVIGTLGAAIIGNWDKLAGLQPTNSVAQSPNSSTAASTLASDAPHAPPLDVGAGTPVWGEKTRLLALGPGASATLKGAELFTEQATYPVGGCAGPVAIAYTWQVRVPYPKGGDLEITAIRQGGGSDRVGLGSMGSGSMSICDEHTFKNDGLDPIIVEVRYASTDTTLPSAASNGR